MAHTYAPLPLLRAVSSPFCRDLSNNGMKEIIPAEKPGSIIIKSMNIDRAGIVGLDLSRNKFSTVTKHTLSSFAFDEESWSNNM